MVTSLSYLCRVLHTTQVLLSRMHLFRISLSPFFSLSLFVSVFLCLSVSLSSPLCLSLTLSPLSSLHSLPSFFSLLSPTAHLPCDSFFSNLTIAWLLDYLFSVPNLESRASNTVTEIYPQLQVLLSLGLLSELTTSSKKVLPCPSIAPHPHLYFNTMLPLLFFPSILLLGCCSLCNVSRHIISFDPSNPVTLGLAC